MTDQQILFEKVKGILETQGDVTDQIHIIETSDITNEEYDIYHTDGFCWSISREFDEPMVTYSFCEPYDGFKNLGISKAIELLSKV